MRLSLLLMHESSRSFVRLASVRPDERRAQASRREEKRKGKSNLASQPVSQSVNFAGLVGAIAELCAILSVVWRPLDGFVTLAKKYAQYFKY